jgi:ketosteroid isomerase-like protein/heme-degrading monooxygenase HmoA
VEAANVSQEYFEAWNRRDPEAIAATFADGGTYIDPNVPEGLTGWDIAEYAASLFAAFPNLSFDLLGHDSGGDGVVAAQWVMRGTGARVALPGADFIVQEGGKIRSVRGYFDRSDFAEQLGLQVIVSPYSVGSVSFGDSVYLQLGKRTKPAAFSLTSLSVRSDQEAREVRGYGQRILREMSRMPGVIGVLTARVGNRMLTATAWEDTESPRQMLRGSAHEEAVGRFFGSDFTTGGMTSAWRPERINAMWVRCAACGSMEDYELSGKTCRCGQSLPEPPPYW